MLLSARPLAEPDTIHHYAVPSASTHAPSVPPHQPPPPPPPVALGTSLVLPRGISPSISRNLAASPTVSDMGTQCPIYQNVEECMFLYDTPNCDDSGYRTPDYRTLEGGFERDSSERRREVKLDFIRNIPPPPLHEELRKAESDDYDYGSHVRLARSADMRPLSLPPPDLKRGYKSPQKESSMCGLVSCLALSTVVVFTIAFCIYYFFDEIESLVNSTVARL